jgi:hypothetical protein
MHFLHYKLANSLAQACMDSLPGSGGEELEKTVHIFLKWLTFA